jgi:hypothetical protein
MIWTGEDLPCASEVAHAGGGDARHRAKRQSRSSRRHTPLEEPQRIARQSLANLRFAR